jgi:hypothetical protein
MNSRTVIVSAEYDRESHSPLTHRIRMTRTRQFGSDGLSGGSVFHLGRNEEGFFLGLAGFVMRGSQTSEIIHIMGAEMGLLIADRI